MDVCFGNDKRNDRTIPRRDFVNTTTALERTKGFIIFMISGLRVAKFTLGRKFPAKYGFQLISPSDMLRSEVNFVSERGRRFEEIMRQGRHVPTDVIVQLVVKKVMTQPNAVGYLVVGPPREKRQVILLRFHATFDL